MLTGGIPESIGKLSKLQALYIYANNISRKIPTSIGNMTELTYLSIFLNALGGSILVALGNLTSLLDLDLSENHLTGVIPEQILGLSSLTGLILYQNFLTGPLPSQVGNLKNIRQLYISRNNLSGEIPSTLGNCLSLESLLFVGNSFEGTIPSTLGGLKGIKFIDLSQNILSGQIPSICLCYSLLDQKDQRETNYTGSPFGNQYPQLSYAELFQATNGSVYRGILNSGEQCVAVKVLNLQQHGANKSFLAECELSRNIRHRNLVKIITTCSSIDFRGNDFKSLVFEFMPNGSLDNWLHPSLYEQQDRRNLNLIQRLNIAIDVASALDYLHNHCGISISHCDLKPSNVLIDHDLCAHLGDFGLARVLLTSTGILNDTQSSSTGIRGKIGYIAPEYGMGGVASTQGDAYSYGILLLEMFTGK